MLDSCNVSVVPMLSSVQHGVKVSEASEVIVLAEYIILYPWRIMIYLHWLIIICKKYVGPLNFLLSFVTHTDSSAQTSINSIQIWADPQISYLCCQIWLWCNKKWWAQLQGGWSDVRYKNLWRQVVVCTLERQWKRRLHSQQLCGFAIGCTRVC